MQESKRARFDEVLRRIASGMKLEDAFTGEDVPSRKAVKLRCLRDPDFATCYKQAREAGKTARTEAISRRVRDLDSQGMSFADIVSTLGHSPKTVAAALDHVAKSSETGIPSRYKPLYFAGEKVQCLLCGRWYRGLFQHIIKGHGLTLEEYRIRYGIPFESGLAGKDTLRLMSENGVLQYQSEAVRNALATGHHYAHNGESKWSNR